MFDFHALSCTLILVVLLCLAYIREGISDLRIYVAVTSPYPQDRGVTDLVSGKMKEAVIDTIVIQARY